MKHDLQWFMDRVGKDIMLSGASERTFTIKDKNHAWQFFSYSQNNYGSEYQDIPRSNPVTCQLSSWIYSLNKIRDLLMQATEFPGFADVYKPEEQESVKQLIKSVETKINNIRALQAELA